MPNVINCPFCGKLTDPKLDSCPHCGGIVRKGPEPPKQREPSKASKAQTCPNCHALVQDGDIICVACGTNLLTGQKVVRERSVVPTERKQPVWMLVGGAALLLVILGGVIAFFLLSRDPVQQAVQLAAEGNYLEATTLLEGFVAKHPEDARGQYEMGRVYWKRDMFVQAAKAFGAAAEGDPTNTDAALMAVASLASERTQDTTQQQAQILRSVVKQRPDDARAWYLLSLVLAKQGDVEGQIEALQTAIEQGETRDEARQSLAIARAMQGDHATAAKELEALSREQTPVDGDTLAALGAVQSLAGQPEETSARLLEALENGTALKSYALTRLATLLIAEGKMTEATDYLNKALDAQPNNETARFFHAVCLESLGMNEEALRVFDEIAKGSGPFAFEANVRVAELQMILGNENAARTALTTAQQSGTPSAALYTIEGRLYLADGQDSRARDAYRKAIQIDPDYAPARLENGLLFVKQQAFKEGVGELERYLELTGDDSEDSHSVGIRVLVDQLALTIGKNGAAQAGGAAEGRDQS